MIQINDPWRQDDNKTADPPSSMINTCVLVHRLRAFLFLRMFWQSFSGVSAPKPIPNRSINQPPKMIVDQPRPS